MMHRPKLSESHQSTLTKESAIAPKVIGARGYRTIESPKELSDLGFADYQCTVPGLLIPIHNTAGRLALHAYRPDKPRVGKDGKILKYEFPPASAMVVDVPPSILPDVRDAGKTLFITEGAKKADSAVSAGLICISVAGVWNWRGNVEGLGKMTLSDWDDIPFLRRSANGDTFSRDVVLAFDSDVMTKHSVRSAMDRLADMLQRRGAKVRYLLLPAGDTGSKTGLDDYFARGGTVAELKHLIVDRMPELPSEKITFARKSEERLELAPAALYGLAGEIVRLIAPESEADPAAILISLLVGFGNVVGCGGDGRGPYFLVESTKHHVNLFACLVGPSGTARKGTSWNVVQRILADIDQEWAKNRISSGLSSGEGLLYAVRDTDPEATGSAMSFDKRLLVVESEMAQVLKIIEREGNTLSATLRNAWDTGRLHQLVKNNPIRSSNAHVSILGHITETELRRRLGETEVANGFANRFLWLSVRRARHLPEGGRIDPIALDGLTQQLSYAVDAADTAQPMTREDACRQAWAEVYPELTSERWGLHGAVTSRAEAQVLRLSMIYALLDRSLEIRCEHLNAALAVWEYCDRSCRSIFGTALGDPVADKILGNLVDHRPDWVSATEISARLQRHMSAERIESALELLWHAGRIEGQRRTTAGRPVTEWRAL